ncbi:Transmembrane protein 116 [Dissostichus eleginoides]|uniref:Transmembrane protein 116 n=1 Tax=Dissostichus eleginoides TaxID=100907 RepID=A0AAD9FAH9_DISEL|nr:Transmembrane protein 116 [Dissostichus eleginoides]
MSSPERLREDFSNSSVENTTAAPDWTQAYEAVRWIQLTMALLSVLGSGSILVSVMLQRLSRRTECLRPAARSLLDHRSALYSRNHSAHTLCYQLHTVEQVLYMASFFYTLNFVFNLYRGIREQHYSCRDGYVQFSNRVSAAGKITAVLSGLSPVLLMTPVFIQGSLSQCETNFSEPYRCLLMHTGALFLTSEQQPIRACRLLHTYRSVLFLASFLLTLLSIIVLVRKSRRLYRRVVTSAGYLGNQQRACVHLMERRMLLFPLVFLLCWGPAVCLVCVRMVSPAAGQGVVGVVLYVSEALSSPSQGFLNCLLYGWTRARLRRGTTTIFCRDADTQTPLLRSQKKRSYQTLRDL